MEPERKRAVANHRKIECLLLAGVFFAYGYFHQGGGWAENARFAMVRAMVEEGHYWVDDYLIYARAAKPMGEDLLVRVPVTNATFALGGRTIALTWPDADGREKLINDRLDPRTRRVSLEAVAVDSDLGYAGGHLYPNKAPGTSLLAALPYFFIYHAERLLGVNPDDWWTVTVNAWLTTILSVGLLSAFGSVLVFRLACWFSGDQSYPSLLTAVAFGLGTMFFPLATLLQDQNIAGVLLVASFCLWRRAKQERPAVGPSGDRRRQRGLDDGAEWILRRLRRDHQLRAGGIRDCCGRCPGVAEKARTRRLEMVCPGGSGSLVGDLPLQRRLLWFAVYNELPV